MNVFEAGVVLHLVDKVSSGLGAIAMQFTRTQTAANALQARLTAIHSTFHKGLLIAGGGMALALPLVHATKAAEGYQHQLNQMQTAGLSHKEMAQSVAAAWQTTGKVITSTAEENLKVIMDLRSVFGHTGEAIDYMPKFTKIQGAYASVLDGKLAKQADNQTFAMAKALDTIGKIKNHHEMNAAAEGMFRATVATGGRVLPSDYLTTFKYMRQAKFGLNDEFLWKKLPELILENKGSGSGAAGGVGPQIAALYRFGVQGIMNKQAAHNLMGIGLIGANQMMKTTTTGTTLVGGVLGSKLLSQDPVEWVNKVYLPHLVAAKHIDLGNKEALIHASNEILKGNQLATSLVAEIIKKPQVFERFPGLYNKTDSVDAAYDRGMKNDPEINRKALAAAFHNLNTVIGIHVLPVTIPLVNSLAAAIQKTALVLKDSPGIAKAIVGITALSSGALILGGSA